MQRSTVATCKLDELTCMLCIAGEKEVLCWIRNASDAGDERIYGWRLKLLALETNIPYSRDELVKNVRLLYVPAYDRY